MQLEMKVSKHRPCLHSNENIELNSAVGKYRYNEYIDFCVYYQQSKKEMRKKKIRKKKSKKERNKK